MPKSTLEELPHDCKEARKARMEAARKTRWLRLGLCPICGELGPMVRGGAVCKTHGPYEFVNVDKLPCAKFDGGDCWWDDELEDEADE